MFNESFFLPIKEKFISLLEEAIQTVLKYHTKQYPLMLNKIQVSELLGVDVKTFDANYRYRVGFPKEDCKRWSYQAVVDWAANVK